MLEELTVIDKNLPVLTELATSDGLHFKSYVSPDGFSAVVDVLGTTTRVIDGTTTRLRNQVDQATSVQATTVRKLAGIIDSKLDHVCAPVGGPVMQCVPYGDDVSDMKTGYVSADCTGEMATMSPEAGVRNTYECTASTISTVYVLVPQPGPFHIPICQGFDVTGFSECTPLTDREPDTRYRVVGLRPGWPPWLRARMHRRALLMGTAMFVAAAIAFRWARHAAGYWGIDDAGITYAASFELADHHSLALYLEGTPVEGYSNPLVFFLVAILRYIGLFDPVTTHILLETLVFAAMVVMVWALIRTVTGEIAAVTGAVVFATIDRSCENRGSSQPAVPTR